MITLAELAARHPVVLLGDGATPLHELLVVQTGLAAAPAAELIARGGAWLDRVRLADPAWRPPAGAAIAIHTPPGGSYAELEISDTDVLYQDPWLLALAKQPGWHAVATPWDIVASVDAGLARWLARRDLPATHHLAHRLDRDTSGLMLVGLAPAINAALGRAFAGGDVDKRYLALAAGDLADAQVAVLTGHGRGESGLFRTYPAELIGQRLGPQKRPIRAARTTFRVLERLGQATLLEAELHTGRTHQIRLHLRELGHPLLGDRRYGGPTELAGLALTHHLLHAGSLRLAHPATGQPLALAAPPPALFAAALAALRGRAI